MRFPSWVWGWSDFALWLTRPMGRGLIFGIGLAMALAALREVWELVDLLLAGFTRPKEGER
jgi:hypothetical protein